MLNGGGGLNPDGLSLDLQFAADKTLTARKGPTPVFTRASTATFVGSNGLIQSAAVNAARFDHDPVTLASRGLLIEESRTNSITGSNAFNTWTLGNSTVASSSVVTPEGTADAWKLVEDTLLANHNATRSFTPVSGTTYTASVWLKSAENSFAFVGLTGGGVPTTFISVNLSTGAVSTAVGTPVGATSAAYSNGWWRVSFSLAATASLSSNIDIRLSRDGNWANRSYLGNGVNGIYCYGGQVEAGSFATSYIPTTTGSVVRSADVCSYSDVSSFYNPAAGTLVGDLILYTPSTSSTPELFRFGSGNNRIQLGVTSVATEAIRPFIISGGTTTYNSTQGTIVAGTSRKVALTFATNDAISCLNGTLGTQDTSVTMPVSISTAVIGASALTGHIAAIRYYKKRLPNAKLVTLTT